MRKLVIITCSVVLATLLLHSCKKAGGSDTHAQSVSYKGATYDVFKAAYPKDRIQLYWKDDEGSKIKSLANLKHFVEKKGKKLVFATNGGMYMENNSPLGLYIENNKERNHINLLLNGKGNFYLQPNGVFFLTDSVAKVVSTDKFNLFRDKPVFATQSGPMLVVDGTINKMLSPGSSNTNIRSGVGVDKKGKTVFAISNSGVNFYDFASLFKDEPHCDNALFLDGAISEMYLPALNRNDEGGNFGVMIGVAE